MHARQLGKLLEPCARHQPAARWFVIRTTTTSATSTPSMRPEPEHKQQTWRRWRSLASRTCGGSSSGARGRPTRDRRRRPAAPPRRHPLQLLPSSSLSGRAASPASRPGLAGDARLQLHRGDLPVARGGDRALRRRGDHLDEAAPRGRRGLMPPATSPGSKLSPRCAGGARPAAPGAARPLRRGDEPERRPVPPRMESRRWPLLWPRALPGRAALSLERRLPAGSSTRPGEPPPVEPQQQRRHEEQTDDARLGCVILRCSLGGILLISIIVRLVSYSR